MNKLKLEIGFGEYDRTRAMVDGTIKIEGVDPTFHSYRVVIEVFEAMIRHQTTARFGWQNHW